MQRRSTRAPYRNGAHLAISAFNVSAETKEDHSNVHDHTCMLNP